MLLYGKTAAKAIAVMSYLAEHPRELVGSAEIAENRGISHALTAKLLTQLSAAGLIQGQPGPRGGYRLVRDASEINLMSIVTLFEQTKSPSLCPFGANWCGQGEPCPLHDELISLQQHCSDFLQTTRLSVFQSLDAGRVAQSEARSRRKHN